jgi:hypothetical protein
MLLAQTPNTDSLNPEVAPDDQAEIIGGLRWQTDQQPTHRERRDHHESWLSKVRHQLGQLSHYLATLTDKMRRPTIYEIRHLSTTDTEPDEHNITVQEDTIAQNDSGSHFRRRVMNLVLEEFIDHPAQTA